jgi:hypothetical protein
LAEVFQVFFTGSKNIMTTPAPAEECGSPVPALLSSSMDSHEDPDSVDETDFDFQFCPSVFKDLSRAMIREKSLPVASRSSDQKNSSAQEGIDENPKKEESSPSPLEVPDLDMPMFPSAVKSLSRDLQKSMRSQEVEEEQQVELSFRPSAFKNFPCVLFELKENDADDKSATEDSAGNTMDDGWINRMIPSETPTSPQQLFHVPPTSTTWSPPSTPPPQAARLASRRHRYRSDRDVNVNYQNFYNAYSNSSSAQTAPSAAVAGEHLSNEEWIAQGRRRERRQQRRRLQQQREAERDGNGIQVVYRDEDFQPFAVERLEQGDSLLQQQESEQQRLQLEILHAVEDQEQQEAESSPRWRRRVTNRRQHARRLPVTTEARRERLSHWSTAVGRASWRLLKSPFVAVASTISRGDRRLASTEHEETGSDATVVNLRERELIDETAFSGGRGWHHRRPVDENFDSDHGPSSYYSDEDDSTAYWSTGTAMETDWDSSSESSSSSDSSSLTSSPYLTSIDRYDPENEELEGSLGHSGRI